VVNNEVRVDRVFEKYGWSVYPMKGALGNALVGFNILAPVIA
jgi:hypothetical protein